MIREWVIMNCGDGTGVEVAGEDGKGLVVAFRERYEAEEVSPLYPFVTKILLLLPARDFWVIGSLLSSRVWMLMRISSCRSYYYRH